ncbi:hypothetical protein CYMTET_56333 [Cymbomonas tetramitiformis]|uniref:Uncharacterized protein n=1 Tax=Cymbomonas tetramitiformis TaxID=36881 RepID=A0AAE0ENV7_9CHLO|nr:hypothetical protein CYMTET_56333 [Cymbomonas tetramitiformis]
MHSPRTLVIRHFPLNAPHVKACGQGALVFYYTYVGQDHVVQGLDRWLATLMMIRLTALFVMKTSILDAAAMLVIPISCFLFANKAKARLQASVMVVDGLHKEAGVDRLGSACNTGAWCELRE